MPRSPSHATLEATTGKRLAAQLYVTHCLKTDSVEGQAGLSIRATSIHDPAFYKYALDFPSYKIPLDMVAALPTPLQAPRRLALVPTLGGKLALVQSSYVQKDTLGRGGNFFSHFLIYDRISPREALRSWGSPQWQVEYPEGTTQDLPAFPGVPAHGILNDEALATFLTSAEVHADQDLATALYPTRLAGDPECRMRWLRAAIQGYLLARQAGGSGRCRLYILAEPGVVALLLYGIARLLPERLVEDLTFTTYEPSHTSLREFRDARVIGTYTSNLLRGLEADYLNRLGFGIDTFRDKLSPELLQSSLRGCETLLNLAAERDWDAIDELHELWAHDPRASADSLGEASQIQAAFRILSRGEPAIDDLLALQKSPLGQRLLQRPDYQARAWPLVRAALLRPDVAQAFSSLIREPARLRELKAEWCRLLAAGQVEDWKALWDATRRLFVREELLAHLNALLRELKTDDPAHAPPLASRLALLREWQALEPSLPEVRAEHAWLLAASGPGELKELARSGIPGRWVGQACCLCLQGAPSPAVIESIRKADDSLLRGFCEAVSARPDANEILARLLPADDPAAPATFDRLFREGLTLPPASLDALLTRIGADQTTWEGYWRPAGGRTGDHFVAVLSALDPGSAFATRLWNHFCQRLSDDLLVRKRDQRELEEFLQAARAKLPDRVPPACAQALDDWSLLAQHIKTPLEGQSEDLLAACDRRGIASPTTLLKKLFHLQVVASKGKPLSDEHLHAALKCVRGFYPQDEPALASWLEMVNQVADPQLVDRYQAAFLQGADPRESWRALAQKFHGKGLSAEVEKQMLRLGAGSPRPAGALAARTTAAAVLPPWIKIAAIAGAAVVLVALMIPLLLWQRAEAEKRLITAERNQAQAEVLGITDSVRQSERALEAEKLERKDAEGAFAKSEQALKDDLKRLGDAKEKRDALFAQVQTERNQLRQDTSDAVEQARRALYDYHIALAERELMTDNPDKAKAALVNLQVKQRELAQKRGQPAEAANDPDPPMDWEWQVLMRVCDGSSPREYIPRSINSMAFVDVEGKPAIAWSNVDKVAVWVPSTKEEFEFRRRRELKEVHQLAAYGKGQFLALRQNRLVFLGAIKARDRDGKLDLDGKLINMPELDILKLALSPDCKRLATAYKARQTPGLGTFVRIYADTLKQESERAVVSGEVTALCFSPDAQRVAIGIANGSVEFWEATPSRPPLGTLLSQRPLPKDSVNDLAFSPSGGLLAVAKKAGVIELWDLASGAKEPPVVLVHSASTKPVRSVAFSPDGNWIASGSADRTIKIWDAKTSKERLTLWHNQGVTMVAFSPDGNSLASVGETVPGADAILKVWDLSPAPAAPDKQPTPAPPVRAETGDHR